MIKYQVESILIPVDEPLNPDDAKRLIRQILKHGRFAVSGHATDQLRDRGMDIVDCVNIVRGGVVQPPDLERGTWRYRVESGMGCAVVAFRSETEMRLVTAWWKEGRS